MEFRTDDKTFQQIPSYLKFKNLPLNVQQRLLKRQRGESEGFAYKTAGVVSSYYLIALALGWFLLLFYLSDDYLWGNGRVVVFGLISLFASFLLLYNLYKVLQWFTSGAGCFLLITPLYVIDIYFNNINCWKLDQLITVNSIHQPQGGRYEFTQIALTLENGAKTFIIRDIETAEQTVEQINYLRKLFIEATVRNDTEYLNSNDDFIELESQNYGSNKVVRGNNLPRILTVTASIIITTGIMFCGISLNNYYDDKKSWEFSQSLNRASAYRTYLQTHPQGRWANDANLKLQSLYNEAEQKYQASLNKDYDQKAVDAVLQVLRYAKETQNYRIKVVFERKNEIPPDIVEELKKEFEVKKMLSLGDAFSDEKMKRREIGLITVIADAFRQVIPDDVLEISGECFDECVTFRIKYKVFSDSIYYDTSEKDKPEKDRTYYPGIFLDWDFDVQTPNRPQVYNFMLSSDPAEHISYDNVSTEDIGGNADNALNADLRNFYDAMAASAFADFKANLIFKTGIGGAPKSAVEKKAEIETNAAPIKAKAGKK